MTIPGLMGLCCSTLAAVFLATFAFAPAAFAGEATDASATGSGLAGAGVLSLVAAPVVLTGATALGASEGTGQIVKLVSETGEGLSELTVGTLETVLNTTDELSKAVPVVEVHLYRVQQAVPAVEPPQPKKIPLVVRQNLLQMHQRVEN
ncbi:MAG: hypothetical protein SFZ03_11210 [Candidatus Melainabacteria bacterium]|nr:hypothetical protein [Candidatus Melainabacteria bacterium]